MSNHVDLLRFFVTIADSGRMSKKNESPQNQRFDCRGRVRRVGGSRAVTYRRLIEQKRTESDI
jgi:hypothetical protein